MAILQTATTSTGAAATDAQTVHQLCETYYSGILNWGADEEEELIIWGYDAFEIYKAHEDGLPECEGSLVTHEFLQEPANCLKPGKELDIQTTGYAKYQLPALAKRSSVFG